MCWQPAQMSALASACASPLHNASCTMDKSINMRAYMHWYTSAYVHMQTNVLAFSDLGALSWFAGMPALVCAGLESSTCLNVDDNSRRMPPHALGAFGDKSINGSTDSRGMRASARVYVRIHMHMRSWSINQAYARFTRYCDQLRTDWWVEKFWISWTHEQSLNFYCQIAR